MFPRGHSVKTVHGYVNRLYPTANYINRVRLFYFESYLNSAYGIIL